MKKKQMGKQEELREVEIWFDELKPKLQKQLLKMFGIKSAEDVNWDCMPLIVLPNPKLD